MLHRRSDSEPEAMLGAYVSPGWLIFGHLGAIWAPSWLQLGHLGLILALSWAVLAPTWPSWPDLGSVLGHLRLPSGLPKLRKTDGKCWFFKIGAYVSPCWRIFGILKPRWIHLGSNLAMLAPSWSSLGPPLAPFETMLAHLLRSWGHVGSILAPTWLSWPDLGSLWSYVGLPSELLKS